MRQKMWDEVWLCEMSWYEEEFECQADKISLNSCLIIPTLWNPSNNNEAYEIIMYMKYMKYMK